MNRVLNKLLFLKIRIANLSLKPVLSLKPEAQRLKPLLKFFQGGYSPLFAGYEY